MSIEKLLSINGINSSTNSMLCCFSFSLNFSQGTLLFLLPFLQGCKSGFFCKYSFLASDIRFLDSADITCLCFTFINNPNLVAASILSLFILNLELICFKDNPSLCSF